MVAGIEVKDWVAPNQIETWLDAMQTLQCSLGGETSKDWQELYPPYSWHAAEQGSRS